MVSPLSRSVPGGGGRRGMEAYAREAGWMETRKISNNKTPYEFVGSIPKKTRTWSMDELLEELGREDVSIDAWRHNGRKINLFREARNGRVGSIPREVYVFEQPPSLIRVEALVSDHYAMCEVYYLPSTLDGSRLY